MQFNKPHHTASLAQFVGRSIEIEELYKFIQSPDSILFVLVGKPGMGKSELARQLNRQLQEDQRIFLSHLFDANRDLPPEDLASEMIQKLSHGQFFLWGPDDRRKMLTLAGALPMIGPLFKALIDDEKKSNRAKLVEILNLLSRKTEDRIVLIIDPYDYIEKNEYEEFFTTLVRSLTSSVKIIVPQRPADVLAVSSRFLALPTVRRNKSELAPLDENDSRRMIESLLGDSDKDPQRLARLCEQLKGWPLALKIGAHAMARGETTKSLSDIESLCSHLLDTCPREVRQLLYAASLPSLDSYFEDLRAVVGLQPEEFASVLEHATVKQVTVEQNRSSKRSLRLFHVIFRDYVRAYMQRMEISTKTYIERLHSKLLDDAEVAYGEMDTTSVFDRDAIALLFAEKLRVYETLLESNDYMSRMAAILLSRINSPEAGGRSYSLYSLLVLARSNTLLIKQGDAERFLKVLRMVLVQDSFLHPEYAVLLIGSILTTFNTEVDPETKTICKNQITHVAKHASNPFLAEVASSVHYALEQEVNPLLAFELDQLLPTAYRQDDFDQEVDNWLSSQVKERGRRLVETPVSKWTTDDHSFMHRYIRYAEHTR